LKQIATTDAVGHVLCHDITEIVPGVVKDAAFRKGHVVTDADIPKLLSLGKEHLYVWECQEGMLHEDEAAEILYGLCAGPHMLPTPVKEGKIELMAGQDGLFTVDVARLCAVNATGELIIATRHTNSPVKKGDKLAGMRVIPLIIEARKMRIAQTVAGDAPLLALHPYTHKKVGIIVTGNEVYAGRIKDAFTPVLQNKLEAFPSEIIGHKTLGDDPVAITGAIADFVGAGADLVFVSGGMSVDPDDRTPLAIKNTGARVVSYGAPALPGAMFMLSYMASGIPIMGLPGCVMYAARTIFDLVLPRVMADVPVTQPDLAALGHGGLCLNCAPCLFPNCAFGAGQ
jgi:hypothetical protein